MDPSNIKKVQEWVSLDNKILKNKEAIKDIVIQKKQYEEDILEYVTNNKQSNLVINISDGSIRFANKTQTQGLSLKYLKMMLEKYSVDKNNIQHDEIYKYIVDNLEKKTITTIERKFKDQE
jgi:hypothetical protein